MQDLTNSFLLIYAGLFPIINPVGNAPIFLELTQFCTPGQRNDLARRVAFNSFLLLLGSLFIGSHVLGFFGISLPVVRIGGGLVVTALGWRLLNSEPSADRDEAAKGPGSTIPDAFYPLTMPLTVGPGSMSVAVTLGAQRPRLTGLEGLAVLVGAIAGLLALAATIYLAYRFAQSLTSMLGRAGANVLLRLSAFILLCIGIQVIWDGWRQLSGLAR
ncbi:MAG: antibiotic resistance protein [Caulobacteraceae bacterium]|nr:antibiotic resistance protein [Caulobacteraceae bacterium]